MGKARQLQFLCFIFYYCCCLVSLTLSASATVNAPATSTTTQPVSPGNTTAVTTSVIVKPTTCSVCSKKILYRYFVNRPGMPTYFTEIYRATNENLYYSCIGQCRVMRWTIQFWGDCTFAFQVLYRVSGNGYRLLGQNLLSVSNWTRGGLGTEYYYDVAKAEQVEFSGKVYFAYSQLQYTNLATTRYGIGCAVHYSTPLPSQHVPLNNHTTFQTPFLPEPVDSTELPPPSIGDEIAFLNSYAGSMTFTVNVSDVHINSVMAATTPTTPPTTPTTPPTTPTTPPTTEASSTGSAPGTESTVSIGNHQSQLTIIIGVTVVMSGILLCIIGFVSVFLIYRQKPKHSWMPAEPSGNNLPTMSTSSSDSGIAIGSSPVEGGGDGTMPSTGQFSDIAVHNYTSVKCPPRKSSAPVATSGNDQELTVPKSISVDYSDTPAECLQADASLVYELASECSETAPQTPDLPPRNPDNRTATEAVTYEEVGASTIRRSPSPQSRTRATAALTVPGNARRTSAIEAYETLPQISSQIKNLATVFTASPGRLRDYKDEDKPLEKKSPTDTVKYDRPLDSKRFRKFPSPLSSYSNHECRTYRNQSKDGSVSSIVSTGPLYRLPVDAVRVPSDPVVPSDPQPGADFSQCSHCTGTGSQASLGCNGPHEYLEPGDEHQPTRAAATAARRSASLLPGRYCCLDTEIAERVRSKSDTAPPDVYTNPVAAHYRELETPPCTEEEDLFIEPFVPPPESAADIETQLTSQGIERFEPADVVLGNVLGTGAFGVVKIGRLQRQAGSPPTSVAVKQLRDNLSSNADMVVNFMKEALLLGQFHHRHVIELVGVIHTPNQPIQLVLELLSGGDLLSHLRTLERDQSLSSDALVGRLLQFSSDIARGADYLAGKNFIHRDLAARNIMLDASLVCKISDFGLSRKLSESNFYQSRGGKVPIRWTAPEALIFNLYSVSSDVWSFGIALYEIWSLGVKPYASLSPGEIINMLVVENYRLPRPPLCPEDLYRGMIACWLPRPQSRPSFKLMARSMATLSRRHEAVASNPMEEAV